MSDWSDISRLTPYDHLASLATTAADLLRDIAAKSGELTDDDEVQALLTALNTNTAPALLQAIEELLSLVDALPPDAEDAGRPFEQEPAA